MLVPFFRPSEAVLIGDRRVVVLWIDQDEVCLQEELRGSLIQQKVLRILESLDCSNGGWIEVLDIRRSKVRLGFEFPDGDTILRDELINGRRKKRRRR